MLKHQIYYYDETPCTVEDVKDWIPVKAIEITKDPYNYHFIQLKFTLSLKCPIGKTGEAAVFIDKEQQPRITFIYDKSYQDYVIGECQTYDLNYGKHKITLAMKGSITNVQFKVEVLRFYTMIEMLAEYLPLALLSSFFGKLFS
jgi:hypothetical protein